MRYVKQKFIGIIDDIEITNSLLYFTVDNILTSIEDKFGNCYNKTFVKEFVECIIEMYFKYDDFSFGMLEAELTLDVDIFENLTFTYEFMENEFEEINRNLRLGKYSLR